MGEKTISETASHYEIHPDRIIQGKKRLPENATDVLSNKRDLELEEQEKLIEDLNRKIEQQKIEAVRPARPDSAEGLRGAVYYPVVIMLTFRCR